MKENQIKDILADVLKVGELGSRVVCRPVLSAPWDFELTPTNKAFFHMILEGSGLFLENKNSEGILLQEGDLLFIPKVYYYSIMSEEDTKEITKMLCGSYELKSNMSLPFFSLLPSFIHLKAEEISDFPELFHTIQMLREEDALQKIGGELVIAQLLNILLILIVRYWIGTTKDKCTGWLLGTLDEEVAEVLSIIHSRPQDKLTLEVLAKETAMSRTKLLNKFTKVVGMSPIQYLTNWRIDLAKQLLLSTDLSIFEIAYSVGYESEASFGRVFKKIEKTPPSKYRHQHM